MAKSGGHDAEGVREDLATWWKALCPGGLFAGHDHTDKAVAGAVKEFVMNGAGTGLGEQRVGDGGPPSIVVRLPTSGSMPVTRTFDRALSPDNVITYGLRYCALCTVACLGAYSVHTLLQ